MPIKPENKTQMPMLDPLERRRLFHEVNRGYDAPRARFEGMRCLECQEPAYEARPTATQPGGRCGIGSFPFRLSLMIQPGPEALGSWHSEQ